MTIFWDEVLDERMQSSEPCLKARTGESTDQEPYGEFGSIEICSKGGRTRDKIRLGSKKEFVGGVG